MGLKGKMRTEKEGRRVKKSKSLWFEDDNYNSNFLLNLPPCSVGKLLREQRTLLPCIYTGCRRLIILEKKYWVISEIPAGGEGYWHWRGGGRKKREGPIPPTPTNGRNPCHLWKPFFSNPPGFNFFPFFLSSIFAVSHSFIPPLRWKAGEYKVTCSLLFTRQTIWSRRWRPNKFFKIYYPIKPNIN